METNSPLSVFANYLERLAPQEEIAQSEIPGVFTIHSSKSVTAIPNLYEPSVCMLAQGSKQVLLGEEVLRYDAGQCLVTSLDLPVKGTVVGATKNKPYLCMMITLKLDMLFELMPAVSEGGARAGLPQLGLSVHPAGDDLLDCAVKLCKLLDNPRDIPIVAPMVVRELHYRLLAGPHGESLREISTRGGSTQRIGSVVKYLRENFAKPVGIAHLAKIARMSESSLHAHFKSATSMSPLQFQKQLRLLEARRRLVVTGADATTTAYAVGYESNSQFSREYSRMFGLPPLKDAERVRKQPAAWYGSTIS